MKQFEHITEKEILYLAYHSLLEKWLKELERSEKYKAKYGKDESIANHRANRYKKQLDDLHERILELELQEQ